MTMLERSTSRRMPGGLAVRLRLPRALLLVAAAMLLPAWTSAVAAQASPSPQAGEPVESLPPPPSAAPSQASPVTEWEYRTLFLTWDTAALNWVADFSDGTRIEGLDAVLNNEGQHGWELVAVVPELWQQIIDDVIKEDARRLRIFLKRPVG